MWYFIIVGIIAFLSIYFTRPSKRSLKPVDLDEPCHLKFDKNEYNQYEVSFFNPIKNSYWAIPSGYAGIHAPWSFHSKGSYGAYSLERYTCSYHAIDDVRNQFSTLRDIQRVFDRMNREYKEFQASQAKIDALPKTIYK